MRERILAQMRRIAVAGRAVLGRGTSQIVLGTAGGYAVAAALIPILSRLYTPSEFGTFTFVMAVASLLSTVVGLRYELAVAVATKPRVAFDVALLSLLLAGGLSLAMTGGLLAWGSFLIPYFGANASWLWLSPLLAFGIMLSLLVNQISVRRRDYRAIGERNFVNASGGASAQVVLAAFAAGPLGLILGAFVGHLAGALTGTRRLWSRVSSYKRSHATIQRSAIYFKHYPMYLAPAAILNSLGGQLPLILFAMWYGEEFLGHLGMAQRLLALPVALLGTALAQVYLGQITTLARAGQTHQIRKQFRRTSRRLLAVGVPIALVVLVLSPTIFPLLLGPSWKDAGEYARALSLMLLAQFVAQPLSQTLLVAQRHRLQMAADAFRLLVMIVVLPAANALDFSPVVLVWTYSGAFALTYAVYYSLALKVVRNTQTWRMPDAHS